MRYLLVGVWVAMACVAGAQEDTYPPNENLRVENIPPIPVELVNDVERYTDFRSAVFSDWHPSERKMLVRTRFADTAQVHLVEEPLGARQQLTFFEEPVSAASFEPDGGDYLVLNMDQGGGEFYQNFRLDLESREVELITDGEKRNRTGLWNNAGTRIVYERQDAQGDQAFTELHVIDPADPSTDRVLATLPGGGWGSMDWSGNDEQILALEYISPTQSALYTIDAESGERTRIAPAEEGAPVYYGQGMFDKKGKGIYVVTDAYSEFRQLIHLDPDTGAFRIISGHIDWDVEGFDLVEDGSKLAYVTNEAGISKLHVIDATTGKEFDLPKMPVGVIYTLEWHNNGNDLAITTSSAQSTWDVYSIDIEAGTLDRWTRSETGMVNVENFPEPELIEWESFDGRTITGFLYMPPSDKFEGPRPVTVDIHGGPEGQARPYFQGRDNYWLNELGIAIILPNVRGSAGYGKTFIQLDNAFKREDSYKDINALFDWIEERDGLNSEKVMVTGGSYGGFMTLAVAANYGDRIACAVDIVGISNLRTFLENTQGYRRDLRRVEYGDERDPEMREFLDRIAPLNKADQIRKPLFVIQGANDPRVPLSEADQIVAALKETNTPVWYLVAENEGHGFRKKENADYQFYSTVMFVKKYLLDEDV